MECTHCSGSGQTYDEKCWWCDGTGQSATVTTGGTNPGVVIGGTGRSSVDTGNVTDSSQRIVTPPPCPACEAAARELADLRAAVDTMADEWEGKPELSVDGQSGYTMDTLHGFSLMAQALRALLRKETK